MRVVSITAALAVAVLAVPGGVAAQAGLSLPEVLAAARERAPRIVGARLALEEARGRLAGASIRLTSNPEVEVAAGDRRHAGRSTDLDVGVSQRFDAPGARAARVAGATARLAEATAAADEITRTVLRDAARAYYRAVFAAERLRLLASAETLASSVFGAADRRHRAGDIPVLDVNLAKASLARARAERLAGEADEAAALGEIRALLQRQDTVAVRGDLAIPAAPDPAALRRASGDRPELRALDAAIRDADAEIALGRAMGRPEFGVAARYQREEGSRIVLGGVTVTVPVFAKGQELLAVGSARAARLRAEREATRTRIRIELDAALAAYDKRVAAARLLEAEALPSLGENDALTARSFEVGQIGLTDLLLIRRELLDTRVQYLSTILEAALARVELDAAAAVLR
jgi:cobalt-zinc-cadmium efflux system outer membrane protein